eukprot:352252-Chlamydomonas_euryale.AAC.6
MRDTCRRGAASEDRIMIDELPSTSSARTANPCEASVVEGGLARSGSWPRVVGPLANRPMATVCAVRRGQCRKRNTVPKRCAGDETTRSPAAAAPRAQPPSASTDASPRPS